MCGTKRDHSDSPGPVVCLCVSSCLNARLPVDIKILIQSPQPSSNLCRSLSVTPDRFGNSQPSTGEPDTCLTRFAHRAPFPPPEMSVSMLQIPENKCNAKRLSLPSSAQPYDILVSTIGPKWTRLTRVNSARSGLHGYHTCLSCSHQPFTPSLWLQGQRGIYPTLNVDPPRTRSPHGRVASGRRVRGALSLARKLCVRQIDKVQGLQQTSTSRPDFSMHAMSAAGSLHVERSHLGPVRQSKVTS